MSAEKLDDTLTDELRVMTMVGVSIDLPTPHPEVVLREVAEPWRELRFPIGMPEGVALAHAWRRKQAPRPLTYDAWADVLRQLNMTVEVVRITGAENGVYFAEMVITGGTRTLTIPCRPSDALNLALRQTFSVPILVAESVLRSA